MYGIDVRIVTAAITCTAVFAGCGLLSKPAGGDTSALQKRVQELAHANQALTARIDELTVALRQAREQAASANREYQHLVNQLLTVKRSTITHEANEAARAAAHPQQPAPSPPDDLDRRRRINELTSELLRLLGNANMHQ
jgi:outer membrane murein-binding lipoprotein Lpp